MATVFFTHIKKTAGTSMKRSVFGPHVPKKRCHQFNGYRSALAAVGVFNLVEGHYPYGVHHFYGVEQPRYFVMLREPIDRAVSQYYFIKRCTSPTHTHPNLEYAEETNLVEFYSQPGFQNVQTRAVAGLLSEYVGRYISLNENLRKMVLRRAKRNLIERYEAFGLKERFEESVRLFADCLDVQPKWSKQRHKNTLDRPSVEDLDENIRHSLRQSNDLDAKLYEFACDRFDAQKRG